MRTSTLPREHAELAMQSHVMPAFTTPVATYRWPDSEALNSGLSALVLARERKSPNVARSNVGGWHSASDFLNGDAAPLGTLRDRMMRMVRGLTRTVLLGEDVSRTYVFRFESWANISRNGNYHAVHNHPGSLWSGVYYVSDGEPDTHSPVNGRLELVDPRAGANLLAPAGSILHGRFLIAPTPGLMVMFPSWLFHLVHPFHGQGERISIAFNIVAADVTEERKDQV